MALETRLFTRVAPSARAAPRSKPPKLNVGDTVTVSGKLTCLPSTMPLTGTILVSGALSRTGGSSTLLCFASYPCSVQ